MSSVSHDRVRRVVALEDPVRRPGARARPRPRPRSSVLPNASASGCASRFAVSRSWWSPTTSFARAKPMKSARDQLRALVDQLVVGVLAVRARLAPHDRAGLPLDRLARRGRPTCRCSPSRAAGSTPGGARGTGCTAAPPASRRRRSRRTRCRSARGASAGCVSTGAVRKCSSISVEPGEHLVELRRVRSRPSARARSRSRRSSGRRPSPRTRTCWPGRCRTRVTSSALVDTATKCFATAASSPSVASDHSRAVRAFVIVSSVVNVFDAMMNSVSPGSRSRVASWKSVPSTFETKRNVIERSLKSAERGRGHARAEVAAADPDVHDVAMRSPVCPVHAPRAHPVGEVAPSGRGPRGPRARRPRRRPR